MKSKRVIWLVRKSIEPSAALGLVVVFAQGLGLALSPQTASQSVQPVRPIGAVTEIKPGSLTLHTDAGPSLVVLLPEGVPVLRVPPGAKDLKAATKITVGEISVGDRVMARGHPSQDQKSLVASSLIVMSESDLTKARATERREWRERGVGGLVKAINPAAKEITISVPNLPPVAGNPTHPVIITVAPTSTLLRYAPDSVKFSDAKPGTFDEIKVGDQVRALGTKSADGSHFAAEKLVSGSFRNIGATVVSVDAQAGTVTVKDLATGQAVLVRTNADSSMHVLPAFTAQMLARMNAGGGAPEGGAAQQNGGPPGRSNSGFGPPGGGPNGGHRNGPPDIQQMLERTPPLKLGELKPGEPLIVVSTQGAKPTEVTAIVVLSGVEPILASQPKGSKEMVLGQWNMGMGGGGGGEVGGGP